MITALVFLAASSAAWLALAALDRLCRRRRPPWVAVPLDFASFEWTPADIRAWRGATLPPLEELRRQVALMDASERYMEAILRNWTGLP